MKIVVGMTKDYRPITSDYNPASKTSFKYDSLFKDESAFNLAEKRSALHTLPLLTALSIRRSACST